MGNIVIIGNIIIFLMWALCMVCSAGRQGLYIAFCCPPPSHTPIQTWKTTKHKNHCKSLISQLAVFNVVPYFSTDRQKFNAERKIFLPFNVKSFLQNYSIKGWKSFYHNDKYLSCIFLHVFQSPRPPLPLKVEILVTVASPNTLQHITHLCPMT